MSFQDIFKSSFLENINSVNFVDMGLALVLSFGLGLFIFLVYKKTSPGILYSTSFALTLIGLSLVTTLVIMAVTSNVILSLGMVGALSIVRFRAAIKEPIEIVYLFWSIASGIVVGAGLLPLALIGSAIIGLILWIFASRKTHQSPYMLILRLTDEAGDAAAMQLVKTSADKAIVKAKTVTPGNIELSCEVRLKDASTAFINRLSEINGVESAALVSYNGEYMS